MKQHIEDYKKKLEASIGEYMEMPVTERSATAVKGMLECWQVINGMADESMTAEEAKAWVDSMQNEDGTYGAHWTIDQTTAVAESHGVAFDHISKWCWWATMNMIYSDYCKVAEKFGAGIADFYADMAKAFLFDKDGKEPKAKLASYYHCVAKK